MLEKIEKSEKKISLIHGITGSGKTEIYLHLVEKYLQKNQQVLLIVPEISLTPQTINYFKKTFGNKIAVLHSRLTQKEKSLEWMRIFLEEIPIIIGPRSALFAPVKKLGLIIIDEEHEPTYKQEQQPRYNTKKIAEKIAQVQDVKVVLGSATPSMESYYKARKEKYNLCELKKRINNVKLPNISIVDLRDEFKKKNYSIFSDLLQERITETLSRKKQIILFLNKRGSASSTVCRECGYTEKCESCDVSLTYHKTSIKNRPALICHHCGIMKNIPEKCPECNGHAIKYIGVGTQKVEEEAKKLYPNARIIRVDKDTTAKKGSFEEAYNKLKNEEVDILIGTQMIGKGLHLPNVHLVGVILADTSLHFPDFRSEERTFQLLTQVAGRAGRSKTQGEVVIQTYVPDNNAIKFAKNHDFISFYNNELLSRKEHQYPPKAYLIKLTCTDEIYNNVFEKAKKITDYLNLMNETHLWKNKIYMYPPLLSRLNKIYRWNILIQGENPNELLDEGMKNKDLKWIETKIDIDPLFVS